MFTQTFTEFEIKTCRQVNLLINYFVISGVKKVKYFLIVWKILTRRNTKKKVKTFMERFVMVFKHLKKVNREFTVETTNY